MALTAAAPSRAVELVLAVSQQSAAALPFYIATDKGLFAAENVAVTTIGCAGGGRCFDKLLAGTAQMATSSELPVVMNSFERRDYVVVGTVVTSSRGIRLMARRSAGIAEPAHFAGKRVGVIWASSAHYALDAFLQFHGVDPATVKLVRLTSETLVAALARGEVDAIAAYTQQAVPALKALKADVVVMQDPRIYTETFNLIVQRQTLAQHGPEIVKVLRALESAERFIAAEPLQAKKILIAHTDFDPAFVDAIFPDFQYRLGLEQSLIGAMEGQARWAVREGHVPAGRAIPNYLDFVDTGPLRKAVPTADRKSP